MQTGLLPDFNRSAVSGQTYRLLLITAAASIETLADLYSTDNNSVMDSSLVVVLIVVAGAVSVAVIAWLISWHRQRKLARQAGQWVPVEGRIESGALEGTRESGKVVLPTFAFSYQVSEDFYSGRFSLRANISKPLAESMIDQMIGRKILLRYDAHRPELWFIPEESIDGYKVEQKIGSHVLHDYSPND